MLNGGHEVVSLPSYVRVSTRLTAALTLSCVPAGSWLACQWGPAEPRGGAATIRRPSRAVKGLAHRCAAGGQGKYERGAVQSGWLFQEGGCQC